MSRCRNMVDIGRRQFLRGGAIAAAGATVAAVAPAAAQEPGSSCHPRVLNIRRIDWRT